MGCDGHNPDDYLPRGQIRVSHFLAGMALSIAAGIGGYFLGYYSGTEDVRNIKQAITTSSQPSTQSQPTSQETAELEKIANEFRERANQATGERR